MYKLIKNEFYKIFHKKSTIIMLSIIFLFVFIINYTYKNTSTMAPVEIDINNEYYKDLENRLANFQLDEYNHQEYADLLASIENEKKTIMYMGSWKLEIYVKYLSNMVYDYYQTLYVNEDQNEALKIRQNIDNYLEHLDSDDWRYFTNLRLDAINKNITELKSNPDYVGEVRELEIYEYTKYLLEYRLQNNIDFTDSYLNTILNEQEMYINDKIDYERAQGKEEKEAYKESYATFKENEYILKQKIDTISEPTLRFRIINFFNDYIFLILIFVIMIAGSIVSEEFNKGTIKSLLTIPYPRGKILMAKFITILLLIPFISLFILGVELVVGGIIFGYSSLKVPVIGYNFNIAQVEAMSIFKYLLLSFVTILPMIILLVTLAFMISTVISNTALAVAISLGGYIASEIINALALAYNIKFLNYFVTLNWDLRYLMFGGTSQFNLSLCHSLIVCLVYLLIMVLLSMVVFKKKNIKNI